VRAIVKKVIIAGNAEARAALKKKYVYSKLLCYVHTATVESKHPESEPFLIR
jgi:hypothetical protein